MTKIRLQKNCKIGFIAHIWKLFSVLKIDHCTNYWTGWLEKKGFCCRAKTMKKRPIKNRWLYSYDFLVWKLSFIHVHIRFSLGELRGSRRARNTSWFSIIQLGPQARLDRGHKQDWTGTTSPWQDTKQGDDVITSPGPWSTSGPLSRGCSQEGSPRRFFLGHSGHMAERS